RRGHAGGRTELSVRGCVLRQAPQCATQNLGSIRRALSMRCRRHRALGTALVLAVVGYACGRAKDEGGAGALPPTGAAAGSGASGTQAAGGAAGEDGTAAAGASAQAGGAGAGSGPVPSEGGAGG